MTNETTTSQDELDFIRRGNNSFKAIKLFCEMVLTLPDDLMPLTQERLDELFESRTQALYLAYKENNLTGDEISKALNELLTLIVTTSARRIENQGMALMREANKLSLGYYEPVKEMPLGDLENLVRNLQTND